MGMPIGPEPLESIEAYRQAIAHIDLQLKELDRKESELRRLRGFYLAEIENLKKGAN